MLGALVGIFGNYHIRDNVNHPLFCIFFFPVLFTINKTIDAMNKMKPNTVMVKPISHGSILTLHPMPSINHPKMSRKVYRRFSFALLVI
jgi:hypothetical protein